MNYLQFDNSCVAFASIDKTVASNAAKEIIASIKKMRTTMSEQIGEWVAERVKERRKTIWSRLFEQKLSDKEIFNRCLKDWRIQMEYFRMCDKSQHEDEDIMDFCYEVCSLANYSKNECITISTKGMAMLGL